MQTANYNTGMAFGGLDITFDYLVFLFGPSRQRQDFQASQNYANVAEMAADYARRGTITINTDHSAGTIFATPDLNAKFRFWHDMGHIATGGEFTLDGERIAAEYQMAQVRALVGPSDDDKARWCAIIDEEVNGQAAYYFEHGGEFPADQRAFAREYLTARGWDVDAFPRTLDGLTIEY